MSAILLAEYAQRHAQPEDIRNLKDFKKWIEANRADIERLMPPRTGARAGRSWITEKVVDHAWQMLRSRREY